MNDENVIGKRSQLYKELIDAYECYKTGEDEVHRNRFFRCYEIVDEYDYEEICYVISMIKENTTVESIEFSKVKDIIEAVKIIFGFKLKARMSFLLEILEEARERKRVEGTDKQERLQKR